MDARQPLQPGEDSRRNWRRINAVDADVKAIGQLVGLANGDITSRSRFPIRPGVVLVDVQCMRVKSVQNNYLTCRTWDGTTEGGTDILVAKPYKVRNPASETIDGIAVSYSYVSTTRRTASATGYYSETQVVVPFYLVNDVIFAISTTTDVQVDSEYLEYLALDDGRAWATIQ